MDSVQIVTLVGALVAAATGIVGSALALLGYRRSGTRDELAWRQSALVAAMTLFLDSSFGILSAEGLRARLSGDDARLKRARQRAVTKHTDLVKAQTTLRLVVHAPVVKLGEQVHSLIDIGYDEIFGADIPTTRKRSTRLKTKFGPVAPNSSPPAAQILVWMRVSR